MPLEPDAAIVLRSAVLGQQPVRVGPRAAATVPPVAALPTEAAPTPPSPSREERHREGYEEGLRSGREEGLRSGREDGLRQAQAEARDALQAAVAAAVGPLEERQRQLEALQASLQAAQAQVWDSVEDDMVALCFETICRVLGPALLDVDGLQSQIRALLASSKRREGLALHLHPSDLRRLGECGWTEGQAVSLVPDPSVTLGGCMLRSAGGALDARLETILEVCRTALLEARCERTAHVQKGQG